MAIEHSPPHCRGSFRDGTPEWTQPCRAKRLGVEFLPYNVLEFSLLTCFSNMLPAGLTLPAVIRYLHLLSYSYKD